MEVLQILWLGKQLLWEDVASSHRVIDDIFVYIVMNNKMIDQFLNV